MAFHKTLVYLSILLFNSCAYYHEPSSSTGHNCITIHLMDSFLSLRSKSPASLYRYKYLQNIAPNQLKFLTFKIPTSEPMASLSSSNVATVSRTVPTQATLVAPLTGLKSNVTFPATKKVQNDFSSLPTNGGRVQCMKVWPPLGLKKYETLSYLPPLSDASLAKEVDYLLRNKWVPCLEFEVEHGFVYRENHRSPGYYDGRYWTMWKLPMFGCTDSAQVLKELEEAKKEYPNAFIRIIGFDNVRQVQCISFIAYKPPGY